MSKQMTVACMIACAALAAGGAARAQTGERSGEQIVKMQCAKCHQTGVSGAPRVDDRAAWALRMKQGLDATVRSAIRGHGAMPARGGMADLTDTELRAAILYMFYPAGSKPDAGG
ncbi:MAG TPA: c-type cytochrome [Burkholderiales bacterium]|nr:c-type cytochrome [Burkholderiales bacterium]